MMSYKNTSAQLIVNGHLTRSFDPVFPLIFNLVILPLALFNINLRGPSSLGARIAFASFNTAKGG